MRSFIDILTGTRGRFNDTAIYHGLCVPCLNNKHSSLHTHPHRVPTKLLRELNAAPEYQAALQWELDRRADPTLDQVGAIADYIPTCPECGARTDWAERPDGLEAHVCLDPKCAFQFIVGP